MLGLEYSKTRAALIGFIRYTRALAKRSSTPLEAGEDSLDSQLSRPFRFVVMGEHGSGKTSLIEELAAVKYASLALESPSVSIIRDCSYRVFEEAEDACDKHYITGSKEVEIVEVQDYGSLSDSQHLALDSLLREADLVKFAKSKPLALEIEEDRKDAQDIVSNLKPKPIVEENDELE